MEGIKGKNKINKINKFHNPPQTIFRDRVKGIDYNKTVKNPVINIKSNVIQLISKKIMTLSHLEPTKN